MIFIILLILLVASIGGFVLYQASSSTGIATSATGTPKKNISCAAGNKLVNGKCELCPANTYSLSKATTCTPCASGLFSNAGSSSCVSSLDTTFTNSPEIASSNVASSTSCAAGQYYDNGTCRYCPLGSYSLAGSTSIAECTCPAGKAGINGVCNTCRAGEYSAAGATICERCPSGLTSLEGATSVSQCVCEYGRYKNAAGDCVQCGSGQYVNTARTGCLNCPETQTSSPGAGSIGDCRCPRGTRGSGGYCYACDPGTYSDVTGLTICKTCPDGKTSPAGATSSSQCICPAGTQIDGTGACIPCPDQSYSEAGGTCQPCTGGTVACSCPPGKYINDAGSCVDCIAGSYSNTLDSTSCKWCNPSTYSNAGATGCTPCPAHTTREVSGGTTVVNCLCEAGYYGIGSCTQCPPNTMSVIGTPTIDGCGCIAGTYGIGSQCNTCPPGTTSPAKSQTVNDCQLCNHGQEVINGRCQACRRGFWGVDGICQACPDGQTTHWEGSYRQDDCYCLDNKIWDEINSRCIDPPPCPGGSTTTHSSVPVPEQPGCFCATGARWSVYSNSCIYNNCPTGSSNYMLYVGESVPGHIGCYCDAGKIWNAGSGICIQDCPAYSTRNVTNKPVPGHTGCYCLDSHTWDASKNECTLAFLGCPLNSTPITTDISRPAGSFTGCYCIDNTVWNNDQAACVGDGCPEGTHTRYIGDFVAGSNVCRCPSNNYYGPSGCTNCPAGSYIDGTGKKIDTSKFGNCACPEYTVWNEAQNRCVRECPPYSMKDNDNILNLDATSTAGCYCNLYYTWINDSCQPCPSTSSPANDGMPTGTGTCKCFGSWYNGECKKCANSFDQSYNGLGEMDTTTGCRCRRANETLNADGTCTECPSTSSTASSNTGRPHNDLPRCRCPTGQGWDANYDNCINLTTDGCPIGSSLTSTGAPLGNLYPNCRCDNTNASVVGGISCIPCPGNSNIDNLGPVALYGSPNCRCPALSLWDDYNQSCSSEAANCETRYSYSTSTANDSPIPNTPCYCISGYRWNNIECVDPTLPYDGMY